jgi:hypothetical protein
MKKRDAVKRGSVVEIQAVLSGTRTLSVPVGTLGRVTGQETRKGRHYWEVSFPLPQADADGSIFFYSEERPEMQVLYQSHELKKAHARAPRPEMLVVARFVDRGARYDLYEVTLDERLLGIESLVDLGAMSFAWLPVQASVPVEEVEQFCVQRGWHLLYKEGDRSYLYTAALTYRAGEAEALVSRQTGTVLAASAEDAYRRAVRVLLRDYPPDEHFSGHESVQVEDRA